MTDMEMVGEHLSEERYEAWLDKQERRLMNGGVDVASVGYDRKDRGESVTLVRRDTEGFPVGLLDVFYSGVSKRGEYANGVWQVDVFVHPDARGRGYGVELLEKSEGQLRRKLKDMGRTRGAALLRSVIMPPAEGKYAQTHWQMKGMFERSGFVSVPQDGEGRRVVYEKVVPLGELVGKQRRRD